MNQDWYFLYACVLGAAFVLSLLLTEVVRRVALRLRILDHPGERKVHVKPVPLMGGVAICITFYVVIFGAYLCMRYGMCLSPLGVLGQFLDDLGANAGTKITGILVGAFLIFMLGVMDDLRALSPEVKLIGQVAAALVLVLSGMRIRMFLFEDNVWISCAVTMLWVLTLTNAMNFLDNMDGLAGGVAIIAAFSFFLAVQPFEDQLVRLIVMVFAGSVAGFLCHNLNPARIFMGDAGSMFCGFMLATVAIIGTFHLSDTMSPIAVGAPLLALSVPLFDISSVVFIRWRKGESIMKGDKRHFSHRLVRLGMTQSQAVEFIFLVGAVTGLGAALLSHVGLAGTVIILAQTVGVYLLIVLLMKAGNKAPESMTEDKEDGA